MKLKRANQGEDWTIAHRLLAAVATDLDIRGAALWSKEQLAIDSLKSSYGLNELYFASKNNNLLGVVFIQEQDDLFWPEVEAGESLFFHKLAILPKHQGKGIGYEILDKIVDEARERKKFWVRLDCDNRIELRKFYEGYGFGFIDERVIDRFDVVRYQMPA